VPAFQIRPFYREAQLALRAVVGARELDGFLMDKVTEAKKAAEANLIARREETAAMRSQANTAKLLEGSPTLMRLRELEIMEKVATSGKLNVVLGEKGLVSPTRSPSPPWSAGMCGISPRSYAVSWI